MSLSYFGVGTGDIVLDNVQCTGEEQTLLQCTTSTDHNCNHIEDAGVICGMNAYYFLKISSHFNKFHI